jgi:hypothetical protein
MAQIRRGKDIDLFAAFDTLPHQPGGPEVGPHLQAARFLVIDRDLGHHLPQAPCSIENELPP